MFVEPNYKYQVRIELQDYLQNQLDCKEHITNNLDLPGFVKCKAVSKVIEIVFNPPEEITDEYIFDGNIKDIEQFPVNNKKIFEGCKGLLYRYEVHDLKYDGPTNYRATSPASFGYNMKVTWDDGYNWAHIYQNGKLKVQWKIPEDYYEINVRLFDPHNLLLNLNAPLNNSNLSSSTIDFNWTATDSVNDTSFTTHAYLDNLLNETTTSPNGTLKNIQITGIPDGLHVWFVNVTNGTYMNVSVEWNFIVDTTSPNTITLDSPVENYNSSSANVTFNWTVIDNVATYLLCNITLDDAINNSAYIVAANDTRQNYTIENIPDGNHPINVTCYDWAFNLNTTEMRNITVDTTKPNNITLDAPAEGYNSDSSSVTFNWTVFDNVAGYLYCNLTFDGIVNNTAYIIATNSTRQNYTVDGISDGDHEMNVTCYDWMFNSNVTGLRNITVDITAPTFVLSKPANGTTWTATNADFNWTVTDGVNDTNLTCKFYLDHVLNETRNCGNGTLCNISVDGLPSSGNILWNVNCTDGLNYGNSLVRLLYREDSPVYSINFTLTANISDIYFLPNLSLFNWTTFNITDYNITAWNQTTGNSLFKVHNNGTGSSQIYMALNDTAPNDHIYKCGTSPTVTYMINTTRRLLSTQYIQVNSTWDVWCFLDLIEANSTVEREFNMTI